MSFTLPHACWCLLALHVEDTPPQRVQSLCLFPLGQASTLHSLFGVRTLAAMAEDLAYISTDRASAASDAEALTSCLGGWCGLCGVVWHVVQRLDCAVQGAAMAAAFPPPVPVLSLALTDAHTW